MIHRMIKALIMYSAGSCRSLAHCGGLLVKIARYDIYALASNVAMVTIHATINIDTSPSLVIFRSTPVA